MDLECTTTFTEAQTPATVNGKVQINRRACRANDRNTSGVGIKESKQERITPARRQSAENRKRGKRGSLLLSPPHMFSHVETNWANVRERL